MVDNRVTVKQTKATFTDNTKRELFVEAEVKFEIPIEYITLTFTIDPKPVRRMIRIDE